MHSDEVMMLEVTDCSMLPLESIDVYGAVSTLGSKLTYTLKPMREGEFAIFTVKFSRVPGFIEAFVTFPGSIDTSVGGPTDWSFTRTGLAVDAFW